jgi:hypothetical protein
MAKETGAVTRALKKFCNINNVLRTILLHVGKGYSLKEMAVRAKEAGICDVSDIGILKALRSRKIG